MEPFKGYPQGNDFKKSKTQIQAHTQHNPLLF